MLDPFQLPFMQRAALEVALLAPIAGLLGAQIVLRHLAFFTHGVGTAAFPGLVVAGPAGIPPALAAFAVGGGFAALLERLGRRGGVAWDAATALLLVAALALGIVLASDVFATGAGVDRLLFGSLLAIGGGEILVSAAALLAAVVAAAAFRRDWIVAGFDELGHGSPRRRARFADAVLLVVVAIAAIAAIDAVGALLVSAILVVPAATARLFARSIAGLEAAATAIALAEGLAGLVIAYYLDAPPGAVVAVLGGAIFAVALAGREIGTRGATARRVTA
ncbi:MAG TPA: metal ABC transporter permease [Solirubrobacterales bacterium]|nr:metal ABC transporter permease [Solirubrobacterales bacterium]